jgi:hypothetical protein
VAIKISQFTQISAVASGTILPVVDPTGPTSFNATAGQLQTFVLGGNAATATNLAPSTTTLAATVLNSSLTSVGTLTNLTVTNTISGSINGNAGTVSNGVYTTDTGTVTNTMLAGSIANNKLSNNSVTFNGVTVALGASGTITADVPIATTSVLGAVIVGSGISVAVDGTISVETIDVATTSTAGTVIIGDGINVEVDGTISVATIDVATTAVAGTVIIGNGLQVEVDGTVSTTTTPAFHGFVVNANGDLEYTRMTSGDLEVANGDAAEQYVMWEIGTSDYSWQIADDGNLQIEYTDSDL